MNPSDLQPARDPQEQWLRYLDGALPAEDVAQLNDQLQADSSLRHEFAELLLLQVQLGEIGREVQPSRASRMDLTAGGDRPVPSADRISRVAAAVSGRRRETMPSRRRAATQRSLVSWSIALAASVTLLAGLGVWFFGPTTCEPVLAQVRGGDTSIERGTEFIPATDGTRLQPTDVLRTGTNGAATVTFGPENTKVEVSAGTQLRLISLTKGKRFELRAGKIEASVARQRPFRPMVIVTPRAEARVLGTHFTLETDTKKTTLEVMQGKVKFTRASDGTAVKVTGGSWSVAAVNYRLAALPRAGKVLREIWLDLPGDTLQDLRYHSRYPNAPSRRDFPPTFDTSTNWPSAFGTRTRAYLLPPVSGDYEFRISGNGQVCLWLSPDSDPSNRVKVGQIIFTRNRPDDASPETTRSRQESGPIPMEAGRQYYIEAVHKYGDGEDRLSVFWKRPQGTEEPVPAEFLAPFGPQKGARQ